MSRMDASVRAVTARLAAINLGDERGEEILQNEKRRGFFYIEALSERLQQYETQRDTYPTFVDFYPQLLEVFRELSETDLGPDYYSVPFAGTINQAAIIAIKDTLPSAERSKLPLIKQIA